MSRITPSFHSHISEKGKTLTMASLHWRHNERDDVSNHQPHDCLLNRLNRRRSKKTSKLRVTGLCEGNSPVTGDLPTQRASNAENVLIWWRHHAHKWYPEYTRDVLCDCLYCPCYNGTGLSFVNCCQKSWKSKAPKIPFSVAGPRSHCQDVM